MVKEMQSLAGKVMALSRFMFKVANKVAPFFECLPQDKIILATPPISTKLELEDQLLLYLSVSGKAVSSVLIKEEGQE